MEIWSSFLSYLDNIRDGFVNRGEKALGVECDDDKYLSKCSGSYHVIESYYATEYQDPDSDEPSDEDPGDKVPQQCRIVGPYSDT